MQVPEPGVGNALAATGRARLALALALAITVASSGCMSMAGADTQILPPNYCTTDADCPGATVCDASRSICVTDTPQDVELLLSIRPFDSTNGTGYLQEQRFSLSGNVDDLETDLVLTGYSRLRGTISGPEGGSIEGNVEFTPQVSDLPGEMPAARSASVSGTPFYDLYGSFTFDVKLLPGAYDVRFVPGRTGGADLPPLAMGPIDLPVPAIDPEPAPTVVDVAYPAGLSTLSGTVRLASGDPVPYVVNVWAVDSATGKRVSTVARTPAGPAGIGSFSLVLSPGTASFGMWLSPGPEAASAGFPAASFGPWSLAALDPDDDGLVDLDADPSSAITMPPMGSPVIYMASVEGVGSSGVTVPIEGATVRFYSVKEGATYETYGVTSASGEICRESSEGNLVWGVTLRENDYSVTITPPLGGDFESLVVPMVRVTYSGDGTQMGQVFALGLKPPLMGRFSVAGTGVPLEGLTVEAYPVRSVEGGDGGYPMARFAAGETGYDGMLRLALDRGVYDVLLKSTAGDGVAWTWLEDVSPGNEESPLLVETPPPIVVTGAVWDPSDAPVAGALVSVYELVYSPIPEEPPATRLVWETSTGDSGGYTLLLEP